MTVKDLRKMLSKYHKNAKIVLWTEDNPSQHFNNVKIYSQTRDYKDVLVYIELKN